MHSTSRPTPLKDSQGTYVRTCSLTWTSVFFKFHKCRKKWEKTVGHRETTEAQHSGQKANSHHLKHKERPNLNTTSNSHTSIMRVARGLILLSEDKLLNYVQTLAVKEWLSHCTNACMCAFVSLSLSLCVCVCMHACVHAVLSHCQPFSNTLLGLTQLTNGNHLQPSTAKHPIAPAQGKSHVRLEPTKKWL